MLDHIVDGSSSGSSPSTAIKDPLVQQVQTAIDKTAFVYTLRQLSARGSPVDELVRLAREYNDTRARPDYLVDTFIIENGRGGYSEVDVKTGEVVPKEPYPILPIV